MGLDWCVNDKAKPTMAMFIQERSAVVDSMNEAMSVLWQDFLSKKGEDEPGIYPNPLMDEFGKLPETTAMQEELESARDRLAECYVSGQETLNTPRVGIDEEATRELKRLWSSRRKDIRNSDRSFPDRHTSYWMRPFKEVLEENRGRYMAGMTESDGVGSITGMMASETGFRGKIIGYAENVIGPKLANEAYDDHSPEELVDYGCRLLSAAKNFATLSNSAWIETARESMPAPEIDKALGEDDTLWKLFYCFDAAKWCIFWGERGHGMHAWY